MKNKKAEIQFTKLEKFIGILTIVLLLILFIGALILENSIQKENYTINPPCYYYTNRTEGIIKLFGISPKNISLYQHAEGDFFILNDLDENRSEILECPIELSNLLYSKKNITSSWLKNNTIKIDEENWKYKNFTITKRIE